MDTFIPTHPVGNKNAPKRPDEKPEWEQRGKVWVNRKTGKFATPDMTLDAVLREFEIERKAWGIY